MNKPDLAHTIARLCNVPDADAADQLDRTIHRIINALRHGRPARLPGLGTIQPGHPWTFRPDPQLMAVKEAAEARAAKSPTKTAGRK